MLVECELSKLIINERREQQIVTLREIASPHREFPIVISIFEAVAIDRKLKDVPMVLVRVVCPVRREWQLFVFPGWRG